MLTPGAQPYNSMMPTFKQLSPPPPSAPPPSSHPHLQERVLADPSCIGAERLAQMSGPGVRALLGRTRELPQEEERARLVREVRGGAGEGKRALHAS